MSFGFATGDFIAIGQLAFKLYTDVFLDARNAPEEIKAMTKELSTLHSSTQILIKQVDDPLSALCKAGPDRVQMVNEIMEQVGATLRRLETYSRKHDLAKTSTRSKLQRKWDKIVYAKDASSINALRAKLVYHNGIMTLVLGVSQWVFSREAGRRPD